jgi:hypothetical protein
MEAADCPDYSPAFQVDRCVALFMNVEGGACTCDQSRTIFIISLAEEGTETFVRCVGIKLERFVHVRSD